MTIRRAAFDCQLDQAAVRGDGRRLRPARQMPTASALCAAGSESLQNRAGTGGSLRPLALFYRGEQLDAARLDANVNG